MRQIQWRPIEIASLALIALFTLTIAGFFVFWKITHAPFEPDTPHLQDRR
jgi:hypothetical protein